MEGIYDTTIEVMDSGSNTNTVIHQIEIFANPPIVTPSPSTLPNGAVGDFYEEQLVASGDIITSYTWSVSGLPPGLMASGLTTDTLTISGTPTSDGIYNTIIDVSDGFNTNMFTQPIEIFLTPPIITPSTLPNGIRTISYNEVLTASGGTGLHTWSVVDLPSGLVATPSGINNVILTISGTPDTNGVYNTVITVTDTISMSQITQTITIGPTITPLSLPDGEVGTSYNEMITIDGGLLPYMWDINPLPLGLSHTITGDNFEILTIFGTPSAIGITSIGQVMDSNGDSVNLPDLTINAAITTTTSPTTETPTTTSAPTTVAPTTVAPTTAQPTTEAPITTQPTTVPPTTEAPVETTAPPTTISLTTEAPVETTATPPETTAPQTTEAPVETTAPETTAPETTEPPIETTAPPTTAPQTTAPPTTAPPPDINFRCSSPNANTVNITIYTGFGFDYLVKRNGIPIGSVLSGNNADQVVVDNTLPGVDSYSYTVEILETGDEILVRTDGPFACMTVCILPGAQIQTANGFKLIEDVVSGDLVIDEYGKQVTVTNNIKFGFGRKKVVTFTKNCFGNNLPVDEMAITYGHPIKILNKNGQFTENAIAVQYLVNDQSIVMKSRDVDCTYTLMTEQKTFVMTNGLPVATYSVDGFEESCANYKARNMIMLHSLQ
jgi:Hint domain